MDDSSEDSIQKTKGYRISQRKRKRIEELFGEAKEFMGLRRAKFRRLKYVREQVLVTAAAQNIKRLVKHLTKQGPKREAKAARQAVHSSVGHLFSGIFAIILYDYGKKRKNVGTGSINALIYGFFNSLLTVAC